MRHLPCRPNQLAIVVAALLLLLLVIAGCVISPRRIVNESPSPTPTPNVSPTPTPGTTPSPTPTPMAATVPQFLFVGDPETPLISGFRINDDGSLAPVPGSPFPVGFTPRALWSMGDLLLAVNQDGATAFAVDRETGIFDPQHPAALPDDVSISKLLGAKPRIATFDSSARFWYIIDGNRAELGALRTVHGGRAVLLQTYPVAKNSFLALVEPTSH